MAKRAKQTDVEDYTKRGNGYDPDQVKSFVERVETLKDEERVLKEDFKREKLEPLKEDIDSVIAEASAAGIPKMELKRVLRGREYRRRADAERDKLTPFEQDNYDNIRLALGELSDLLGQAALTVARSTGNGTSARA